MLKNQVPTNKHFKFLYDLDHSFFAFPLKLIKVAEISDAFSIVFKKTLTFEIVL